MASFVSGQKKFDDRRAQQTTALVSWLTGKDKLPIQSVAGDGFEV